MTELGLEFQEDGELLQRKSLKEAVFELLLQRIVAGKTSPGEWLRQEDISTQLGVSQTPVREALDLLVSSGLAERVPYRGVRVPELTPGEIADAYLLRLLLESVAVRLATNNISNEKLNVLMDTIERTRNLLTLDDMSRQRQLNKKFHLSIAEASGNSLLYKLYGMVSNVFPDWRLYEYMFRHPELLQSSLEKEYREHKAIVDAIKARDADLAVLHTIAHIQNLGKELVDYLSIPADLIKGKEQQLGSLT